MSTPKHQKVIADALMEMSELKTPRMTHSPYCQWCGTGKNPRVLLDRLLVCPTCDRIGEPRA